MQATLAYRRSLIDAALEAMKHRAEAKGETEARIHRGGKPFPAEDCEFPEDCVQEFPEEEAQDFPDYEPDAEYPEEGEYPEDAGYADADFAEDAEGAERCESEVGA